MTSSEDEAWEVAAWDVYADMSGQIHHEKSSAAEPQFRIPDFKFQNQRCERIPLRRINAPHEEVHLQSYRERGHGFMSRRALALQFAQELSRPLFEVRRIEKSANHCHRICARGKHLAGVL